MVRVFSKFRQSAADAREELHRRSNDVSEGKVVAYNETTVAFNPIQHPTEPLENDQPVQCPFPHPSLLKDGRIRKERASMVVQKRAKTPVEAEARRTKHRAPTQGIMLSISAPENSIPNLLQDCNEHGINFNT